MARRAVRKEAPEAAAAAEAAAATAPLSAAAPVAAGGGNLESKLVTRICSATSFFWHACCLSPLVLM